MNASYYPASGAISCYNPHYIGTLTTYYNTKPSFSRYFIDTFKKKKRDINLKYLLKINETYYFQKRINKNKVFKVSLKTKDIIQAIKKRDIILNDINDYLQIEKYNDGSVKNIKIEEHDSPEMVQMVLKTLDNKPSYKTDLDFETLLDKFRSYKVRIEKKSKSYITDINSSLKYLMWFIEQHNIKDLTQMNSQFFNKMQKDFFSIPKNFFYTQYKDCDLEELKGYYFDDDIIPHDKTINKHFIIFNEFFNFLVRENFIENNPIKIKFIKVDKTISQKEPLTDDEIIKIFNSSIKPHILDFFKFNMFTALRSGEIGHLKIKDINFDEKYFIIRNSKTASGIRKIPIHEELVEIVLKHSKNKDIEDFLFFEGNNDANQKTMNRAFRKIIKDKNKSVQSFRKNATQKLYEISEKETDIKSITGHSQLQNITFTTYNKSKINLEKLREIINKIQYNFDEVFETDIF